METSALVILYLLGSLLEMVLVFVKPRMLLAVPVIISCILFLVYREQDIFFLACVQSLIGFVGALVLYAVDHLSKKKGRKPNEEEKAIIKDL